MHPHLSVVCLIMSLSHTHAHTPLRSVWRVIMCFTCRPLSVQAFMSRQVIPDVGEPAELLLINPSEAKFPTFSSLFIANSPQKTEQVRKLTRRSCRKGPLPPRCAAIRSPCGEKGPERLLMSLSRCWLFHTADKKPRQLFYKCFVCKKI